MKLAIIGGGSTYTPELVDGFARLRTELPITELALVNPAADRLEAVGAVSRRIFAKQGHPGRVLTTDSVEEGADGADAVLFQLRIGGQAARNVAIGFQRRFAADLGVTPERIQLDHVGLNHLTWERGVKLDGAEILPAIIERSAGQIAERNQIPEEVIRHLGMIPSYYLRYYY